MSTPASVVRSLAEMVDMKTLTSEQLNKLNCTEAACFMIHNITETMEGIACLAADEDNCGSFQSPESVFRLLAGLSQSIDCATAAIEIGNDAAFELSQRNGWRNE
jgi:hypothetical protein